MNGAGKWIASHRILILIVSLILLIPSVFGMVHMRTNYDLLTYLPDSLETVKGQEILTDDFGMGAFSMIVVENKSMKDTAKLEKDLEAVPHVKEVLWYDDVADLTLPVEMIPEDLRDKFFHGDATMMLALLDDGTSSDASMEAVDQITQIVDADCHVSGMTAILNDLRSLADREVPIYVSIAVLLSLAAMLLLTDSFAVPFLFLISIGFAILYNMGTNFMFGEISYITKAVAAVLQLGVTMDYSIFLLGSYRENKEKYPDDRETAMGQAVASTFKSVLGSSVTTVAGFIALCFMTFTLGIDMGLVMAKGVIFGVITCITVLPSLVLVFDGLITKTAHRPILRGTDKLSAFITKHYKVWLLVFLALLIPAVWGYKNTAVYYDMSASLPETLPSKIAQEEVKDDFGASTMHVILMDQNLPMRDKKAMLDQVKKVDGVSWDLGLGSLIGSSLPEEMLPDDLRGKLQSGGYELAFVSTPYHVGMDEINRQIDEINEIVHSYDPGAMVIGEAPLTKDMMKITDIDFKNVSMASLGIIFVIIMLVFRSLSLPAILELVIEFAIFINMGIPYYTGTELPFVASIILGTVQLGSTVDYAILMTSRYQKERQAGHDKKEAVQIAHKTSIVSILTSGISFFAATFGVAIYSQIDVIRSICLLLARGALISTCVVIFILPGMFMIFDSLIVHTSLQFLQKKGNSRVRNHLQEGKQYA